jgi:hypothetical protein
MLFGRMLPDIFAVDEELQVELVSQASNKLLIPVGLRPAQLVIEMNNRHNNAEFLPQLQQHAQECSRINSPRNGDTDTVPSPQQFLPPNVSKHALSQWMHGTMVQQQDLCLDSRPRLSAERSSGLVRSSSPFTC